MLEGFVHQTLLSNIYKCMHTSHFVGHLSVMQSLSKKGVYVVDPRESAVTEMVLAQTKPFKIVRHMNPNIVCYVRNKL